MINWKHKESVGQTEFIELGRITRSGFKIQLLSFICTRHFTVNAMLLILAFDRRLGIIAELSILNGRPANSCRHPGDALCSDRQASGNYRRTLLVGQASRNSSSILSLLPVGVQDASSAGVPNLPTKSGRWSYHVLSLG